MLLSKFHFLLFFVFIVSREASAGFDEYPQMRMCDGSEEPDAAQRIHSRGLLKFLKSSYGGCTHIVGHLSISNIHDKNADLSFLSNITEVAGSVYIFANTVPIIPLPKLRVIRGQDHYMDQNSKYALFIASNHAPEGMAGYVDLSSLASIMNHNVYVGHNDRMCNLHTIKWSKILEDSKTQRVVQKPTKIKCRVSEKCSSKCPKIGDKQYCWGPTSTMCQLIDKCDQSACAATGARCHTKPDGKKQGCCHEECVGGCTGISRKDCFACRNFLNGKECQRACPPETIYDPSKYRQEPNPNFKYTLGTLCVKSCPKTYLIEEDSCVKKCSFKTYPRGGKCIPCHGDKCKKVCRIDNLTDAVLKEKPEIFTILKIKDKKYLTHTLRSVLIQLQNCTIVDGSIKVTAASYRDVGVDEYIRPQDLDNLKNIKRINGVIYLFLKKYPSIKSLHFLSNLESVSTSSADEGISIYFSKLEYLGLNSLKNATVKTIRVAMNDDLCYMENFAARFPNVPPSKILISRNRANCTEEKKVCDRACLPAKGCWGPGPTMCVECRSWRAGKSCVVKCNEVPGYYEKPGTTGICSKCHSECRRSCTGPSARECLGGCKTAKDGPFCVAECPKVKYLDKKDGICKNCAKGCITNEDKESGYIGDSAACTGPSSSPGPNGCSSCGIVEMTRNRKVNRCVSNCSSAGYYESRVTSYDKKRNPVLNTHIRKAYGRLCLKCHRYCKMCYGMSEKSCFECWPENYLIGENECQEKCDDQSFKDVDKSGKRVCTPCHPNCRTGCNGTTAFDCFACRKMRIYLDDKRVKFSCNDTCPAALKYKNSDAVSGDTVCSATPISERRKKLTVGLSIGAVIIICIIFGAIIFVCVQRRRAELLIDRDRLHAKYTRKVEEEAVALNATDYTPNLGHLRIISAKRLTKLTEIGSGAFGTVFKGIWKPEKEKSNELEINIDVAIKELKGHDSTSTKDFLSEAHVMASVDHPFCMGLLGVCMSTHMQLVSEFMPLGSLSSYLPKHRGALGSQRLLTWAMQIAKGMLYLENRGIVHRDLAARNVLIQNEEQVRITDFGLAKLLDPGGDEIHAAAGKFPVKWLAIESLADRTFSHKSDVWSFGVTLWELFTFGDRPYSDLRANSMYEFLESGERLKQPEICTLDLYMLLIKCWLLDPESRPTFSELVDDIAQMASDPGRYLIIESAGRQERQLQNDNLRRAPARASNHESDSTSPRLSNMYPEKPNKGTVVQLPPPAGVPHLESQLARRQQPPTSPADHYCDDPVSMQLPPPPPPPPASPPAPKAGFEELDDADVETGDFEVDDTYLIPDAPGGPADAFSDNFLLLPTKKH